MKCDRLAKKNEKKRKSSHQINNTWIKRGNGETNHTWGEMENVGHKLLDGLTAEWEEQTHLR